MKKSLLITIIALAVIIITVLSFYKGNQAVADIGGKQVSVNEFRIYLYEQKVELERRGGADIWEYPFEGASIESIAKQNALDSVAYVKIAVIQASKMGITLSEDEKAAAEAEADLYIAEAGDSFSMDKDAITSVMQEMKLVDKVYEAVTDSYELSEADFFSYYNEYLEESRDEYLLIEIQYVFVKGLDEEAREKISEARKSVYQGASFESVAVGFSDDYDKSTGVVTLTEIPSQWDSVLRDAAYSLDAGEISEILEAKDGYYILYAKSVALPDMEELKNALRDNYILQKKDKIYEQEHEKWSKDIVIKKNEDVWDKMTIASLSGAYFQIRSKAIGNISGCFFMCAVHGK